MLFQISSVAASATAADALNCQLKTSWKWLLVWGSLSFQTLRRGMNLRLDFGGTSVLMSHTRSWCCRTVSLPGITFTSVKSLRMVLRKRMKSICMTMFPNLYIMRWLSLWDSVSTASHSSSQSVYIECSHPEFPRVLAWFAMMTRPCLPHLTSQAWGVTNRALISIGTT